MFLFITFTGKLAELVLLRYILSLGLLVAGWLLLRDLGIEWEDTTALHGRGQGHMDGMDGMGLVGNYLWGFCC